MLIAPIRTPFRRALLIALLVGAAFAAICGSAGAQPGPDDDPDYNDPMWRYANPADVCADTALPARDVPSADGSAQATFPDDKWCGNEEPPKELPIPVPDDEPHPLAEEQAAGAG